MCKALEKQMKEMLAGGRPTITTKAITILAMDLDKKFENVDSKLDLILETVQSNKKDTDIKLEKIKQEQEESCKQHKIEVSEKFKKLDANVETINFFQKHPNVLRNIAIFMLFLLGMALGKSDFFEMIKSLF